MLKFFRRIRQKLIDKGNLKRYLIYAIGEILLVVIGILIALQINNWNEQKKEKAKISVYLSSLVEDLEDDQKNFDRIISREVFRYYSLQYLYRLARREPGEASIDRQNILPCTPFAAVPPFSRNSVWKKPLPKEYDKDFIDQTFIWSTRLSNREVNQSTLEELKNTGAFSLLDEKLKDSINNYYSEWEWRIGPDNYNAASILVEKWQEALMQEGINNFIPFENADPVKVLRDDPYKTALICKKIRECSWVISSASHLEGLAKRLIMEVEKD